MSSRALLCLFAFCACGDDGGAATPDANSPTDVPFGTTAVVVVVNPTINEANAKTGLAAPGSVVSGVTLTTDDNVSATTGADGIAVLAPVTAGTRTIHVPGAVSGGTFTVTGPDTTLRKVRCSTGNGSAR